MIYVECIYCRSCWWSRIRNSTWWLCRFCFASRDARTGWTLSPDRLN